MLNPQYTGMVEQIKDAFQDPALPVVALQQFLEPDAFAALVAVCKDGWTHACIPDQYSYSTKDLPPFDAARSFVEQVTGKKPLVLPNRRFAHRDFTLLHDEISPEAGVLALLFLEDWNEDWGGAIVFMKDGEMLGRFTPQANTLLIVERKEGVQEFVQYVNHDAEHDLTILSV